MGKMLSVSSTRCPHLRPAQGLFLQALHIFPELSTNLMGSSAPYSSSRLILGRFILLSVFIAIVEQFPEEADSEIST